MLAGQALGPFPSEEDVARGLHQPLALHHSLTLIRESALADEGSEHRVLSLLGLEEERIGVVATEHEDDPRARADAAHADHLVRRMDEAEVLQEVPAIPEEAPTVGAHELVEPIQERRGLVGRQELLDGDDEWRVAHDPRLPVHDVGQLVERLDAVLRAGLLDEALGLLEALLTEERLEPGEPLAYLEA